MQGLNSLKTNWRHKAVCFSIALPIIAADQLSKLWIKTNLALGESIPETGFLRLTHIHNTGASFGIFQGQYMILAVLSIIGICIITYLIVFMYHRFHFLSVTSVKIGLGLMLGGMVGNLIDRLSYGYVTDFINFSFWPAFNVADSATVVGALVLAYSFIRLAQNDELTDGKDA